MSDQEIRKANCSLSQLYTSIKNQLEHNYVKAALDKINNINHQIPASKHLELMNSELIGGTILHLVANKDMYEYVDLILSHGADFTIKNNNASTAVHQVIQKSKPLPIMSNNKLISCILDAHVRLNICTNPRDKNGISHFHAACLTNNVKAVEYFLNNGVYINESINDDSSILPGCTSLHIAVNSCALETVELLLNYGASLQIKNADEMTPLDVLLEQKLKISDSLNAEIEENLCLQQHYKKYCYHKKILTASSVQRKLSKSAAENFEIIDKIAHLFLEYYCKNDEFDKTDENVSTYLNIAATLNDSSVLKLMLKKDKTVNICKKSMVCQGYTALHFAALFSINTLKSLLIKEGTNIEVSSTNGITPFDICMEKYSIEEIHSIMSMITTWTNIVLTDCQTSLVDLIYAMQKFDDFSSFLAKIGKSKNLHVPVDSPLWPGYTPLHIAVILNRRVKGLHCPYELKEKYVEIVRDCLEYERISVTFQDANGWTPIHLAFRLNIDVIDLLLKNHSAITNPADNDGLTHLHIAVLTGNTDFTEKLLLNGAKVNAAVKCTIKYEVNEKTLLYSGKPSVCFVNAGSTPLHAAVKNGNHEIVKILLKYGGDPYAKDIYDATPIHYEIVNPISHVKGNSILQLLPDLKNCVAVGGLDHLHVASYVKEIDAIDRLLNIGADVNAKLTYQSDSCDDPMCFLAKYNDFTALNFALMNSSLKVTKFLLQRGADIFMTNTPLYDALSGTRGNSTVFIEALKNDITTQTRMEKHSGVTMLHVACDTIDPVLVKHLLYNGADVNKRTNIDSTIWPGYTPLHCLMNVSNKGLFGGGFASGFRGILRLLLDNGADVTLQNAGLDTPLHLAYTLFRKSQEKFDILTMAKSHRNFLINPVNRAGISHFHIACSVKELTIVKQFLDCNSNLDANEPIDYFCDELAGFAPLHLAVSNSNEQTPKISSQLEIIKLLLERGADVDAEDASGNTPLHVAAKSLFSSVAVLGIIIEAGANLKTTNILGETPLEILLKSKNSKGSEIDLLLTQGCKVNFFNAFSKEGYIAMTISKRHHSSLEKTAFEKMIKKTDLTRKDEKGRTIIHNIVSTGSPFISDNDYVDLFEKFSKPDCDIDSQDNLGRTPLHVAVQFRNYEAVAGLLKAGADVNILDIDRKSAFTYVFESSEVANELEDYNYSGIIMRILAVHVQRLQLSGLSVHPLNENLKIEAFEKCALDINVDNVKEYFYSELERAKSVTFGSYNLTLYDLLSETGAVASYPTMIFVERRKLAEFFEISHKYKLYSEYIDLACLLKLQYRKAVARVLIIESAKESLNIAARINLPKLCCEAVLRFLNNKDLINLTAAMS